MICPYCSNEMIKGKLLPNRPASFKWRADDEKRLLGIWVTNEIKLEHKYYGAYSDLYSMGTPYIESSVCSECRKIIADF